MLREVTEVPVTQTVRSTPALLCRGLRVEYDGDPVLVDLDLTVAAGEVVALLGPSGSGKTTLLHTIAGFVPPVGGEVWLAGGLVASAHHQEPPERRAVGMVFQNYALWPHMSALDTVGYPLRRAGMSRAEARSLALVLLDRLHAGHLAGRRPAQLSGGEQQRVGLARALARRGAVNLFDEPTAHLDAALRATVQEEVAEAQRRTGAAAVYATHDAGEALAVADRVVLLQRGRVVQSGSPRTIYEEPVDLWAATLTGPAFVVRGEVRAGSPGRAVVRIAGAQVEVAAPDGADVTAPDGAEVAAPDGADVTAPHRVVVGGEVQVLVRPEWTALGGPLPGQVGRVHYRGAHSDYRLDTPAGPVLVRDGGPPRLRVGDQTTWALRRGWLLTPPAATRG